MNISRNSRYLLVAVRLAGAVLVVSALACESDRVVPALASQAGSPAFAATAAHAPVSSEAGSNARTPPPLGATSPSRSQAATAGGDSKAAAVTTPDSPRGDVAPPLSDADAGSPSEPDSRPARDPGLGAWERVPEEDVRDVCRLDPEELARADARLATPWVAIRYGRLCHSFKVEGMEAQEAVSATKLLGATVAGAVAYQTRDLARRGRKTGPFSDEDRVDHWLDDVPYNRDARVAHVLAMVAQNKDLRLGKREMEYDIFGFTQLDSLSGVLNAAIGQDHAKLGANLEAFVQHYFFVPLGMKQSSWSGGAADKSFGFSWVTTPLDMARLGLLILRGGAWNGTQILDREWTYRTTHPVFEDANTGFGYCTWLNASSNYTMGKRPLPDGWTEPATVPHNPGPCAPVSVFREHPHGLSESPNCNYAAPYRCEQRYDVGVWNSVAGFGKVIQGHPGLDLVLVVWDLMLDDFFAMPAPGLLWDAVQPAVIAADPKFKGDAKAFCAAYGANEYAPDLD